MWSQNGTFITSTNGNTNGSLPIKTNGLYDIFISEKNVLYGVQPHPPTILVIPLDSPSHAFSVRNNGTGDRIDQFKRIASAVIRGEYIYIADEDDRRVQRWLINGTNPITVRSVSHPSGNKSAAPCSDFETYKIVMDDMGYIYLSDVQRGQIIKFSADPSNTEWSTLIIGRNNNASNCTSPLNFPYGIFLHENRFLYIADTDHHRIQRKIIGENGPFSFTTVAGITNRSGPGNTHLKNPSGVVVDANGYMYIADTGNFRIMRWAPNATKGECIVACTGRNGDRPNELKYPRAIAFDREGSLYVNDHSNDRIQKFAIVKNTSDPITSTVSASSTIWCIVLWKWLLLFFMVHWYDIED